MHRSIACRGLLVVTLSGVLAAVSATSVAQTASWIAPVATGGASGTNQWNNTANWSTGAVPNAAGAVVTFSGSYSLGTNNVQLLGSATTTVGTLNMTSLGANGKLNLAATSGTAFLRLDSGAASQPIINYTNGQSFDNFINVVLTGSQGYEKTGGGTIQVSGANNIYTGTTKITGGGVRFIRNANLGDPTSAGTIQLNGGTLYLRSDAGNVALDDRAAFANAPGANKRSVSVTAGTQASPSTLNLEITSTTSTTLEITGNLTSSTSSAWFRKTGGGTLNLRGAANNMLGPTQLDYGITNMSGALNTFSGVSIGVTNTAPSATLPVAVLNWTGSGTVASGAASLVINDAGTNIAPSLAVTSGTLTIGTGSASSTGGLYVGGKGSGTATVNGGLLNVAANKTVSLGAFLQYGNNNGRGILNILSGTMRANGAGEFNVGYAQTLANGTFAGTGIVNLTGGVLETNRSIATGSSSQAVASGTFNFDGGTLRAGGNQANLLAVTTANVGDGGAVIDSNGFSVTIAQSLLSAGSGGLTKNGAGTLTLTGSNAYSGNTVVNAGVLSIASLNSLPGVTTAGRYSIANDAVLAVTNAVSEAEFSQIVATGNVAAGQFVGFDTSTANRTVSSDNTFTQGLAKVGGNNLLLSGANSFGGGVRLMGGLIQLESADAIGSTGTITFAGGGLAPTVNNTTDYSGRFDTSAGQAYNVNLNGQNMTWATSLSSTGASSLTRAGEGVLALTGQNSTIGTGGFTVNGGTTTINPGGNGGFAVAGRLTVHNATTSGSSTVLRIESGSNSLSTVNGIAGIGDASSGSGSLVIAGGQTTMTLTTNRLLIGNKSNGTLDIAGGSFTINGANDLVVGGDTSFALSNASGAINVSSGTLSITAAGNLRLGVNVSGSTTGATGTINLAGGVFESARAITMLTGSQAGTGTVIFNGGTLRALASSANFIAVTTANVQNGGAVIDTNAFNVTIAQSLQNAGSGGLTKLGAGILTLSGSNAYAGSTAVNGGTLKAGNVNAFGAGAVTIGNGAILDLSALAITNPITNNGGTVSNAASYAGSQTLSGSSTFGNLGGTVTVDNGGVANFTGAMTGGVSVNGGGIATVASSGSVAGGVSVASTGLLGGSGIVGAISGAGMVGPGNSPGILTSMGSLDPSGGMDFSFEFEGATPTWSAATASLNDVLHLTAATPMTAALSGSSGNVINVYLNAGSLTAGSTFLGGIFIDAPKETLDLAPLVSGATFAYFVAGGSDVTYNGVGYSTLANYMTANPGITGITPSTTTVISADFATGTVTSGQVMQMVVVPEPNALAIVATGALAAGWTAVRRLRRR